MNLNNSLTPLDTRIVAVIREHNILCPQGVSEHLTYLLILAVYVKKDNSAT